jgi:Uma2 family endonuclease
MIYRREHGPLNIALRISFDEYLQMIVDDAFHALGDRRIELIHGELREMTPPGPDHSGAIDWVTEWSVLSPPRGQVTVRVQNPVAIPLFDSAPQPDVVWAKRRDYRDRYPLPDEVLLCIEVAFSSLEYDCSEKADLYAAAGIQDYWVIDLQNRVIHVFRSPSSAGYSQRVTVGFGDELRPLSFPQVKFKLEELFTLG